MEGKKPLMLLKVEYFQQENKEKGLKSILDKQILPIALVQLQAGNN